jgi:hypothetical protein
LLFVLIGLALGLMSHQSTPPIAELAKNSQPIKKYFSQQIIPETDLPPVGTRSLFDHLIVQNNGLPYPFSKLITFVKRAKSYRSRACRLVNS